MFSTGPSYEKLKTNLRLSMSRLKLCQKKKAELGQKSRKEIADFIAINKPDRARIRVEHIIREDYYCEAMEMIEMYCDLLLARFGLLKESAVLDAGLQESVSSIIWAAPRMATDVPEIRNVCEQLGKKYGDQYIKGVRDQVIDTMNAKLMHRLSADAPPRALVESYMKEIAASHGLKYEPQVVEDDEPRGPGGGGGLIEFDPTEPPIPFGFRPELVDPSKTPKAANMAPGFEPMLPEVNMPGPAYPPAFPSNPPAMPKAPKTDSPYDPSTIDLPPPSYDRATLGPQSFPPDLDFNDIPDLPDVPYSQAPTPRGDKDVDVDFDELSKRFEDLKRRK